MPLTEASGASRRLNRNRGKLWSVKRLSRTSDDQGGWEETFATVAQVYGRLVARSGTSGSEEEIGDQERAALEHVFTAKSGVDIRRKDRLENGGITVEVQRIKNRSGEAQFAAVCQEIQQVE